MKRENRRKIKKAIDKQKSLRAEIEKAYEKKIWSAVANTGVTEEENQLYWSLFVNGYLAGKAA